MTRRPPDPLEHVVTAIQQRWGVNALRRLERDASRAGGLSTGITALDSILGDGLPRGAMTCLSGERTSGKTTLALDALAHAQAEGEVTVYIDLHRALDPEYAERRKVNLEQMPIAWPHSPVLGLAIARDIVTAGGAGLLVMDASDRVLTPNPPKELAHALRQLSAAVRRARYALLFLTAAKPDPLSAAVVSRADLHLRVERLRWLWDERGVNGYETRITVLKTRSGPPGRCVSLSLTSGERRSRT